MLSLAAPEVDLLTGAVTLSATATPGGPARVTFAAQTGDGPWRVLGVADATTGGAYRAADDLAGVPAGTVVRYKAVVRDTAGHLAHATTSLTVAGR